MTYLDTGPTAVKGYSQDPDLQDAFGLVLSHYTELGMGFLINVHQFSPELVENENPKLVSAGLFMVKSVRTIFM